MSLAGAKYWRRGFKTLTEKEKTDLMERVKSSEKLAYTVKEAAQLLSLSRSLIYELINCGKIRTIKIGRARRITRDQLEEFVSARVKEM